MKFRNRRCLCGRKAEVMISESDLNPCRLFFRCKWKTCNFFEWRRLEDDNEFSEDDSDGVTSRLNISEIEQSSTNFVYEYQYLERNNLDELKVSVVGLKSVVKMLLFLVVLLVLIIIFKWLCCLNEMHFRIVNVTPWLFTRTFN